jgi:prepilin-type N-terminal cleavage/methylation domain-containing protein
MNLVRQRRGGFTLIEMIVLIMIMAILSGIAVPAYSRFHARMQFDKNVQDVITLLSWARDTAQQLGGECVVELDRQTNIFVATPEQPAQITDQPADMVQTDQAAQQLYPRQVMLPETITVAEFVQFGTQSDYNSGGQSRLRFHADGTCDGVGLTLAGINGHTATIEVSPMTGRIALNRSMVNQ